MHLRYANFVRKYFFSSTLISLFLVILFLFVPNKTYAQVCTTTPGGTCLNGGTCYMGSFSNGSYQTCNTCPAGYTGSSSTCLAQTNRAPGMCCIPVNKPTPTTPPKANCPSSGQICDTSNLRGAKPGGACSTSGYIYSTQLKFNTPQLVTCSSGGSNGACCEQKSASTAPYPQGTCSNGSICYTGDYNTDHLIPGAQCGTLPDWHFGNDGNGKVAMCGTTAPCCDKGTATVGFSYQPPCVKDSKGNCTSVNTGFGSISTNVTSAISTLFGILLSFSGGVAIILIIFSGYRIMTSGGNPEKIKGSREMLTAAIIGLLFVIFSVSILQVIGVDILHLPGFVSGPTTSGGSGGRTVK